MSVTFYATIDADSQRPQWMPQGDYLLPATSFYRKGFPSPRIPEGCNVAADCGGFVATKVWGSYRFSVPEYVDWLYSIPNLRWAATWDFCCEQEVAGSEGIVRERQVWTQELAEHFIENYGDAPWAWVPTIQGWTVEDYLQAADDMEPLIRALQSYYYERPGYLYETTDEPDPGELERVERNMLDFRVGIGTLCARKSVEDIHAIVSALIERFPGVRFHLWGVKLQALAKWPGGLPSEVISTDSAAWNGRFGSDISALNADMKARGFSQREYAYKVRLPYYRERFEAIVGQPEGVAPIHFSDPIVEPTPVESQPVEIVPMTPAALVKARKELGLSQAQLAKELDASPNTIACWERGDKAIGNPKMLALALWALKAQRSA